MLYLTYLLKYSLYQEKGFKLVCKAPNEVMHAHINGIDYLIVGSTNWDQKSDRDANLDTIPINQGEGAGLYHGYYSKFLDIKRELNLLPFNGHIVFGGFSQGGAMAQLLGAYFNQMTIAFASPKVGPEPELFFKRTEKLKNIFIVNHEFDSTPLYPPVKWWSFFKNGYCGDDYILANDGQVHSASWYSRLTRLFKLSPEWNGDIVHDEKFYYKCWVQSC